MLTTLWKMSVVPSQIPKMARPTVIRVVKIRSFRHLYVIWPESTPARVKTMNPKGTLGLAKSWAEMAPKAPMIRSR